MTDRPGHTILLGGIGADSHSVGLSVLRHALTAHGYRTLYLGTQNRLERFFAAASLADAVFVSSLDGHARHYVRGFPELLAAHGPRPLWYIGGNLTIGDRADGEADFLDMGFRRAFVKFVDLARLLALLRRDLADVVPVPHLPGLWERHRAPGRVPALPVDHRALEPAELLTCRPGVLAAWPTGAQALDLDENAAVLAARPSFTAAQRPAAAGGSAMLAQPRCGVPLVADQLRLLRALEAAGARVLSYQADSLTRNNDYVGAQRGIEESRHGGAALNGFPVVNHGPAALRRIGARLSVPLQVRHSTRDPRLIAELSLAGGVTAFEGGPICYNLPYYPDYHLAESLERWRYVDRLCGLYEERYGVRVDREFFGTLTGTLVPPCIAIVVDLLEMVLAVGQGVRSVSLGYAEQGNRAQDVAAVRVLREQAERLLRSLGHTGVEVFTVYHQYMAAFPEDRRRAAELIRESARTAALSGATRMLVKSTAEAVGIPTLEDNLEAMALVARGIGSAGGGDGVDLRRVAEEEDVIRREVECLLDGVLFCGGGDVSAGVVRAFERGWLEVPFSPSVYNRGEVLTARDAAGAVRFLSVGQLRLDRALREFHEQRMGERRRLEGVRPGEDHLLVERDVLRVPRGEYARWPLDR